MLPVSALPPSPAVTAKGNGPDSTARGTDADAGAHGAGVLPFALILASAGEAGGAPEATLAAVPPRDETETAAGAEAIPVASPLLFAAYLAREPDPDADAAKRIREDNVPTVDATANARAAAAIPVDDVALPGAATPEDATLSAGAQRDDRRPAPAVPAFAAAAVPVADAATTATQAGMTAAAAATTDAARGAARRTEAPPLARAAGAVANAKAGAGADAPDAIVPARANPASADAPNTGASLDTADTAPTTPQSGVNADAARARAMAATAPAATPAPPTSRAAAPVAAPLVAVAAAVAPLQETPVAPSDAPGAPAAATLAAPTMPATAARTDAPVVATPVGAEGWTQDVAQHLAHVVTLRNGHAELQLTPPHLGPIEVRISFAAGDPSIAITAADPGTRAALEQSLPQLRELLANQGITLGQAFVQGEAQRQQAYAQAPQRTPAEDAPAAAIAQSVPAAASRSRGGDRLVDTFA